ncbi:Peptidyl-prolyl cis-trans isomerase cyp10 [Myotisia sp. PD_48]|nr:Peptidyl-prolyl cis-trans isomerase cyp10 [Myotisia sp. PD_48]
MSVTLHTTHGDLKVELFCEAVPKTAENFLALCAAGAYNNTPFHRLIPSFMIQGGDISLSTNLNSRQGSTLPFEIPKGGTSVYYPEPLEQEIHLPNLRHNARGILSMAGKPVKTSTGIGGAVPKDINGSQFFITFAPAAHLDGKSTVFGKVLNLNPSGSKDGDELDTLTRLEKANVKIDKKGRVKQPTHTYKQGEESDAGEMLAIEGVTIHANPFAS